MPQVFRLIPESELPPTPVSNWVAPVRDTRLTHEEHLRREGVRIRRKRPKEEPLQTMMQSLGIDEEARRAENLRKYLEFKERQKNGEASPPHE